MRIDTRAVKHYDLFDIAAPVDKLISSGLFTINDILEIMGEPEIEEEWAKQHFITKNYATIQEVLKGIENTQGGGGRMKEQKYYLLELDEAEKEADLIIFGDITSYAGTESDVSAYNLSMKLETLEADTINVHINSCGGEVAEGLAIYNRLKQHKAKIKTYCDGFACSIASVIFMAGDERVMSNASTLMIHNPWTWISGNAAELRKTAEDLG